jgi:polysaccharide export outer membrane protein
MAMSRAQQAAPTVSQAAAVERPGEAAVEVASAWHSVQRLGSDGMPVAVAEGAPVRLTGAARASIDMPTPQEGPALPALPARPTLLARLPPPPTPEKKVVAVGHVTFHEGPPAAAVPKEFGKQSFPIYRIEPPDVLRVIALPAVLNPVNEPLPGSILVRMDGTIGLGVYGNVYVAGDTLEEARVKVAQAIFARTKSNLGLQGTLDGIQVDVLAFNSKVYYVITDGGGYGEQVYPIPIKGNETVLDAIGQINGLPAVASKKKIWVARATPEHSPHPLLLPVNWCAITKFGEASTNYQIFPNDRIYVESDPLIRVDSILAKLLAPVNRAFGSVLLGSQTVNSLKTGSVGSSGPTR